MITVERVLVKTLNILHFSVHRKHNYSIINVRPHLSKVLCWESSRAAKQLKEEAEVSFPLSRSALSNSFTGRKISLKPALNTLSVNYDFV